MIRFVPLASNARLNSHATTRGWMAHVAPTGSTWANGGRNLRRAEVAPDVYAEYGPRSASQASSTQGMVVASEKVEASERDQ